MSNSSGTIIHVKKNEVRVWEKVVPICNVIFDIGCREDTHFLELANEGTSIHMFDVNTETIERLKSSLMPRAGVNLNIHSYGLGMETRDVHYFPNTESAYFRPTLSDPRNIKTFHVKSVVDHIKNYPVESIDFCKIDTEGYEMEIMQSLSASGAMTGMIQFEVGYCWFEKEGRENSITALNHLINQYEIYAIFDQRNPYFANKDRVIARITSISEVLPFLDRSYGFDFLLPLHARFKPVLDELLDLGVTDGEIATAISIHNSL